MKIVFVDRKPLKLFTIADVAAMLGIHRTTLWTRAKQHMTFPAPTYRWGHRDYYTESDLAALPLNAATEE